MNRKLKLVDADEPSRQKIALAEIQQENREAKWTPFSESQKSPTFDPDKVLEASSVYKYAIIQAPFPWYIKLLRRLRGVNYD